MDYSTLVASYGISAYVMIQTSPLSWGCQLWGRCDTYLAHVPPHPAVATLDSHLLWPHSPPPPNHIPAVKPCICCKPFASQPDHLVWLLVSYISYSSSWAPLQQEHVSLERSVWMSTEYGLAGVISENLSAPKLKVSCCARRVKMQHFSPVKPSQANMLRREFS